MPFHTALTRDEFVHSDASLDRLLGFVLGAIDPTIPEDCVCWDGKGRGCAVVLSTGRVVCFDAPPTAPAAPPADLAGGLVAIGVVVVKAKGVVGRRWGEGRAFKALPIVSAALVMCVGLWLCYHRLPAAPAP
jgi:hypothetical protein